MLRTSRIISQSSCMFSDKILCPKYLNSVTEMETGRDIVRYCILRILQIIVHCHNDTTARKRIITYSVTVKQQWPAIMMAPAHIAAATQIVQ